MFNFDKAIGKMIHGTKKKGASIKKQNQWKSFSPIKRNQLRTKLKDTDGDRVPDIFDCNPFNVMKQDNYIQVKNRKAIPHWALNQLNNKQRIKANQMLAAGVGAGEIVEKYNLYNPYKGLPSHPKHTITNSEMLQGLRDVYQKQGNKLTSQDLKKHNLPSMNVYVRRFNSWNEALKLAGLPINIPSNTFRPVTHELLNKYSDKRFDKNVSGLKRYREIERKPIYTSPEYKAKVNLDYKTNLKLRATRKNYYDYYNNLPEVIERRKEQYPERYKKYYAKIKDNPEYKAKNKIRSKKYRQRPEVKERVSDYVRKRYQIPEVRENIKKARKERAKVPGVIERRRELERIRYHNTDLKEKKSKYNKEYIQQPEVRERILARQKERYYKIKKFYQQALNQGMDRTSALQWANKQYKLTLGENINARKNK